MVSPTLGEDVHADEAAHLGPLVVLLGKDCADEAGECLEVGKMLATSVRRRISR
jgi:hypothetical protein